MAVDAVLVGSKFSGNAALTTVGGTTTTGNTFAILLSWDSDANIVTIGDSKSNTYTLAGTVQTNGGHKKAIYYCQNGTGGASHTASATFNDNSDGTIYLVEVTGAATASFDQVAQGNDAASPFTVTTPTLSQADEVVLTICGAGDGGTITYVSSNTTILSQESDGNSFWTSAISKLVVSATTAVTPSFTGPSGTDGALVAVTFKAAASGSSATATPGVGAVTLNGKTPTTSAFQNVRIRQVLVNESGQPVQSAANITLLVWYGGVCHGAPDVSLNGMTSDANGTTSWSIATGTLGYQDRIFYVAQDSLSFSNYTCARLIPSYE